MPSTEAMALSLQMHGITGDNPLNQVVEADAPIISTALASSTWPCAEHGRRGRGWRWTKSRSLLGHIGLSTPCD